MNQNRQQWQPESYVKHAGFVAELGLAVVELLNPQPGERILDLGCGDGRLTEKLVQMGCEVVGVDGSAAQVAAAQAKGLTALVMDGQQLTFANEFDAVFSNAALHCMKQADAVVAGVRRALRENGRFVGEMGGHGNVDIIRTVLHEALRQRGIDPETADPWYFPTPEVYQAKLEAHGFRVTSIELIPRPTPLPGDISGWLDTFAESFTNCLPQNERARFVAALREELRPLLCDEAGQWTADYVRLRFAAVCS
jgi:trans-aconitate methyltransferase